MTGFYKLFFNISVLSGESYDICTKLKKVLKPVSITGFSSISPLGHETNSIWEKYLDNQHCITWKNHQDENTPVAQLSNLCEKKLDLIKRAAPHYQDLDKTVLMSLVTARKACKEANWSATDDFGINIGSSRGATALFEKYHAEFLKHGKTPTLTSPTTTLGNIASWVAHDLQTSGPEISHSITCSTALHSFLNGIAWIQSGMTEKFMVGGSEAPLTPFTIAQMKSLKIYAKDLALPYPCQALELEKIKNSMFLGEGAAVACLEEGKHPKAKAHIIGIGYATEPLKHNISISTDADCFQNSMKMALKDNAHQEIDCIVMHAPGTIKGDLSEYNAIRKVFGAKHPPLTSNKWKIGHTFGASGILSIELALLILEKQLFIPVPFAKKSIDRREHISKKIRSILVNAVGFGGNAVSIILELPKE